MKKKIKYKFKIKDIGYDFYSVFKFRFGGIHHDIYLTYEKDLGYTVMFLVKENIKSKKHVYIGAKYVPFDRIKEYMIYYLGRNFTQYLPDEIMSRVILRKMF